MIDFYTWLTPNGLKASIMLEEAGLNYRLIPVNIGAGEQFDPAFLSINPMIRAIVDRDGYEGKPITHFESATILQYLAEKSGQFIPRNPEQRWEVLQWVTFQASSMGLILGQVQHFRQYADQDIPYAIDRYSREARRLYTVLVHQLADNPYVAGEMYTIADIMVYPWIKPYKRQGQNLVDVPQIRAWRDRVVARPAVQRALAHLASIQQDTSLNEIQRNHLFKGS